MGLFTSDKKVKITEAFPGQRKMSKEFSKAALPAALERLSTLGDPYSGKLLAGLSDFEGTGLDILSRYLSQGAIGDNGLFGAAKNEYMNTLGGSTYDPSQGDYYKAFRTAAMKELQDAQNRLNAQTSASDMYFGGGRIKQGAELQAQTTNALLAELGKLALQERQNRLNAAPAAANLGMTEFGMPLQQVAASQQYGALPREIEQAGLNSQYKEYQRQLADLNLALDIVQALGRMPQNYSYSGGGFKDWVTDTAGIVGILGGIQAGGIPFTGGGGWGGLNTTPGFGTTPTHQGTMFA